MASFVRTIRYTRQQKFNVHSRVQSWMRQRPRIHKIIATTAITIIIDDHYLSIREHSRVRVFVCVALICVPKVNYFSFHCGALVYYNNPDNSTEWWMDVNYFSLFAYLLCIDYVRAMNIAQCFLDCNAHKLYTHTHTDCLLHTIKHTQSPLWFVVCWLQSWIRIWVNTILFVQTEIEKEVIGGWEDGFVRRVFV